MEFKLSVITLMLVLGSLQGCRIKRDDNFDQDYENCFKEANITDPKIKEQAINNGASSYPGENCFLKCVWMALKMVDKNGMFIIDSLIGSLQVENVTAVGNLCRKEAKKKKKEGPCEVFYAGYFCLHTYVHQ